jgi:hypothetical protein
VVSAAGAAFLPPPAIGATGEQAYDRRVVVLRGLRRAVGLAAPAALLTAAAPAGAARARTAAGEIRSSILRVERAVLRDDPGACALMTRTVQRELLGSGRTLAHDRRAGCRQAVRRVHATYAAYGELSSLRQILHEDLGTLATSPVLFAFGGRRASVTVIGSEPEPDGSEMQTTLVFTVAAAGGRWRVIGLQERQQPVE